MCEERQWVLLVCIVTGKHKDQVYLFAHPTGEGKRGTQTKNTHLKTLAFSVCPLSKTHSWGIAVWHKPNPLLLARWGVGLFRGGGGWRVE